MTAAPAQQYIVHLTIPGERWDSLGWRYYGDATNYAGIIAANPSVPIVPVFDQGTTVYVPLIQASSPLTATQDLPPWGSL